MGWPELAACVGGARAQFAADATAVRATQEALLRGILERHAASACGRRCGFAGLRDLDAFRRAVPATDYESLAPAIARMAEGESRHLVDEPVVAFERTGGSSGGTKLIPLTASGLGCLQRGLHAWLDDLCRARPAVTAGSSYWSMSPAARAPEVTPGGIRVGLASDAEYFGAAAPHIAGVLCVAPAVAALCDIGRWRAATLQSLLADRRLALVSVWSPTFWLELCRHAVTMREELVAAIAAGRWAVPMPPALAQRLPAPAADPRRAAHLASALGAASPDWPAVWPQLALISCWTQASSEPWAAQLARQFPHVLMQGKGLLATEGIVSLPLCDGGDPVAAVSSTVLEFEDDDGNSLACDEVVPGGEYTVLLTTSAGLYRYRLGDRVRVTGRWHGAPRLRLLGRAATGSDLCGEKLTEAFVVNCWAAFEGVTGRLVPRALPAAGYEIVLDAADHDAAAARQIALRLDAALRANPQYAYARDLGQLAPLAARRVDRLAARLQALAVAQGQRVGDAKPAVLGRLGEPDLAGLAG
jgi:hypothetical protein